jgi:hypothetical protein
VFANYESWDSTHMAINEYRKFDSGSGVSFLARF